MSEKQIVLINKTVFSHLSLFLSLILSPTRTFSPPFFLSLTNYLIWHCGFFVQTRSNEMIKEIAKKYFRINMPYRRFKWY